MGSQRGQSLIVAIIVMFVLLFVGAVFVGLVARNLGNSGRARDTLAAQSFAEAGIRYCDYYLMNSPEGADWRPAPTPIPVSNVLVQQGDPDLQYLQNGYSRIELAGGRALVRVSYGPHVITDPTDPANQMLDPNGKYIKIETVGRVGEVNPADPTSYLKLPSPRLRREFVAYKAIGITDYLRFVTNRYNEAKAEAYFGVQPIGVPLWMQLGGMPVKTFYPLPPFLDHTGKQVMGAPIRTNCDLRFGNQITVAEDRRSADAVYSAGSIFVDTNVPNNPTQQGARFNDLKANPVNTDPTALPLITSSESANYDSFMGIIRDYAGFPDKNGYTRGISRLEPPLLDTPDAATGFTRYRLLTRNSGKFLNANGNEIDLGPIGLGAGLYIDNFQGMQAQPGTSGAGTLESEWLNPNETNVSSSNWKGPFYAPPGDQIDFGYWTAADRDATGKRTGGAAVTLPGFHIERHGNPFRDLLGVQNSNFSMSFTYFIYKPAGQPPQLKIQSDFYRDELGQAPFNMTDPQIDQFLSPFNGVIYDEGNVRVKGLLASSQFIPVRRDPADTDTWTDQQIRDAIHPSLTVVSNDNIYIDGSVIRESASSMVGLFAKNYVTVNTTQFVGPHDTLPDFASNGDSVAPTYDSIGTGNPFRLEFLFGEDPGGYQSSTGGQSIVNLLVRHGVDPSGGGGTTFMDMKVNDQLSGGPWSSPYPFNVAASVTYPPPLNYWTYPIPQATVAGQPPALFEERPFQLLPKPNKPSGNPYLFTGDAGYTWPFGLTDTLMFELDSSYQSVPEENYDFGRAAVVPMDVRIEAVIYAQNGSFFIIPGYPLNNNAQDDRDQDHRNAGAGAAPGALKRPVGTDDFFPLYGEPIDCRITLVGAIAENKTATPADQTAWMRQWGWIPQDYGSTGHDPATNAPEQQIPKQHAFVNDVNGPVMDMRTQAERTFYDAANNVGITRGLRFVYDPALAAPFEGYDPANRPFRTDFSTYSGTNPTQSQGRTLPPLPRLPVCPNFVFYGEVR